MSEIIKENCKLITLLRDAIMGGSCLALSWIIIKKYTVGLLFLELFWGNEEGEPGPACTDFAEFFIFCNVPLPLGSLLWLHLEDLVLPLLQVPSTLHVLLFCFSARSILIIIPHAYFSLQTGSSLEIWLFYSLQSLAQGLAQNRSLMQVCGMSWKVSSHRAKGGAWENGSQVNFYSLFFFRSIWNNFIILKRFTKRDSTC